MAVFTPTFRAALTGLALFFGLSASAQVTVRPHVERQTSAEVNIAQVQLTPEYTILTFRYRIAGRRRPPKEQVPPGLRDFYDYLDPTYTSTIGFQPTSQLVVRTGGSTRSFPFVKVQGIPADPDRLDVQPGDAGTFRVYFERLDPGMVLFDLFECRSEGSYTCWNYTNVRIVNPRKRGRSLAPTPPAKPVPPVRPPLAKRSTPAVPKPGDKRASPRPPVKAKPIPPARPPLAKRPAPTAPKPLPPVATPAPEGEVLVRGQVFDSETKQPIEASLSYLNGGRVVGTASTIGGLGVYRLSLPKGRYDYDVTAPGYERLNEALDLTQPAGLTQVDRDIFLKPLRNNTPTPEPVTPKPPVVATTPPVRTPLSDLPPVVGRKIELKNVLFEASKAVLLPGSYETLDDLAQWMKENPTVEIRLEGHTDRLGDSQKNLQLSLDRVIAVKRHLTGKGIDPTRVQTKGYGDKRPLTNATTEEERRKNRRVEVVVVKS